jgi:formate dehydrogenase subunit delta
VSSDKLLKMVGMANQIAAYFRAMPDDEALHGTAAHLRLYWTPKMRGEIIAYVEHGGVGLDPLAARAVRELAREASRA